MLLAPLHMRTTLQGLDGISVRLGANVLCTALHGQTSVRLTIENALLRFRCRNADAKVAKNVATSHPHTPLVMFKVPFRSSKSSSHDLSDVESIYVRALQYTCV